MAADHDDEADGDDEDEEMRADTQREAAAKDMPGETTGRKEILSHSLVERWCKNAKEKNSFAAFERLMKVRASAN